MTQFLLDDPFSMFDDFRLTNPETKRFPNPTIVLFTIENQLDKVTRALSVTATAENKKLKILDHRIPMNFPDGIYQYKLFRIWIRAQEPRLSGSISKDSFQERSAHQTIVFNNWKSGWIKLEVVLDGWKVEETEINYGQVVEQDQ
uniref:DUF1842 domain-containing protein n=1 Tax=Syphacia muris TaxID=451379 RepID=A0A0N5ASU7_9BILA